MENRAETARKTDGNEEEQAAGRTARLLSDIRRTPIFHQLIPQEAGVGWPIPLMREGRAYVKLPFFGFSRDHLKKRTLLFPPFATITLDWKNLKPVEYVNLRFRGLWPEEVLARPAGVFPHPAIARMKRAQYLSARNELLSMYDELFETMDRGEHPGPEWAGRFGSLLRLLAEPSLVPFYRQLGPRFYEMFFAQAAQSAADAS